MKLQRIRYFVTLAQTLNFSRTAEIHYVSQTTISLQIQALENELGVELFRRSRHKVELTPAGRTFLEDARKILDMMDRAEEKMRLFKNREDDALQLRLCIDSGVTPAPLAQLLTEFKDANPDIEVTYSLRRVGDVRPMLIAGETDVGITFGVGAVEQIDSRRIEIAQLELRVVVSNRSHVAQHAVVTREQLADEPQITLAEWSDYTPAPPQNGIPSRDNERNGRDIVAENIWSALLAASLGDGYVLLAESIIDTIPLSLNLAAIPLAEKKTPLVASALSANPNPAIKLFFDFVREWQNRSIA